MHRRFKLTLIYLVGATIVGLLAALLADYAGFTVFIPPVAFGLALIESNIPHLRRPVAYLLVPFLFLLIYVFGSILIASAGMRITSNTWLLMLFSTLFTWLLVWLVVITSLKNLSISYIQPVLLVLLAVIRTFIITYLQTHVSPIPLESVSTPTRFLFAYVLLDQLSLTLVILSMMRKSPSSTDQFLSEQPPL